MQVAGKEKGEMKMSIGKGEGIHQRDGWEGKHKGVLPGTVL